MGSSSLPASSIATLEVKGTIGVALYAEGDVRVFLVTDSEDVTRFSVTSADDLGTCRLKNELAEK